MMLETATTIAVIAALVALLSAVYARWQARAAQHANEISLHEGRLSIYRGVGRFRVHITSRGTGILEEEVWKLAETVELSEFYFPSEIHKRLDEVFKNALRLLTLNDEWEHRKREDPSTAGALVEPRHALMRTTRDECQAITELVKVHLRVGGTS